MRPPPQQPSSPEGAERPHKGEVLLSAFVYGVTSTAEKRNERVLYLPLSRLIRPRSGTCSGSLTCLRSDAQRRKMNTGNNKSNIKKCLEKQNMGKGEEVGSRVWGSNSEH